MEKSPMEVKRVKRGLLVKPTGCKAASNGAWQLLMEQREK